MYNNTVFKKLSQFKNEYDNKKMNSLFVHCIIINCFNIVKQIDKSLIVHIRRF